MNPKAIGEKSEGMILAALLRAGKIVLQPFGDNQRYDLVIDEGDGKFVRVQCKTGRLKNGVIEFRTCSTHYHRGHKSKGYRGEADLFGVYVPALDKVYLVPVDEVPTRGTYLRVDPPKIRNKKIRLASNYEL